MIEADHGRLNSNIERLLSDVEFDETGGRNRCISDFPRPF